MAMARRQKRERAVVPILITAVILAIAANPGCLNDVIDPPESRPTVIRNQRLEIPQNKCDTLPLKHGNIPL